VQHKVSTATSWPYTDNGMLQATTNSTLEYWVVNAPISQASVSSKYVCGLRQSSIGFAMQARPYLTQIRFESTVFSTVFRTDTYPKQPPSWIESSPISILLGSRLLEINHPRHLLAGNSARIRHRKPFFSLLGHGYSKQAGIGTKAFAWSVNNIFDIR